MMKSKRTYIIFFQLLLLFNLSGQVENPFEIKSRMNSGENNPGTRDQSIEATSAPQDQVALDTLVSQLEASPKTNEPEQLLSKDNNSDNPFEINRKKSNGTVEPVVEESRSNEEVKSPSEERPLIEALPESGDFSESFLFWVILLAFLILAVGLSLDRWHITKLFKGILNYNLSNTMMREATGLKNILLAILYLLFIVSAALFVYLTHKYFTGRVGANYLLYSFAFVFVIYFIRHLAMHSLYYVFPDLKEALVYSYSIATFNIVAGISLLIPVLLMAYSTKIVVLIALIVGLSILGILYLLRSFRGILIAFKYLNNSPIQFFLYLCAFEIVPLFVVYKILTDFI
jgi:hypothetical protein